MSGLSQAPCEAYWTRVEWMRVGGVWIRLKAIQRLPMQ